ncbi:MAG: NADH-quinone oxidoreductase subunit J [Limnochordales bacterium]|nr:NADH-quinone oxidoreductase subunit J [Limnochordales bacterium]
MSTTLLVFFALAAISLLAAWRVVTDPQIMHAGLWMGLCFVGVAGIFLLLTAEFLAGVQILVYVGAITTIILFGIMLSDVEEVQPQEPPFYRFRRRFGRWWQPALPLLVAAAFLVALFTIYGQAGWSDLQPVGPAASTPAGLDIPAIGHALFGPYALPAEAASVLLLSALLGALVLAMREETLRVFRGSPGSSRVLQPGSGMAGREVNAGETDHPGQDEKKEVGAGT